MKIDWKKYPWANWAAVDKKGAIFLFRDKPMCVEESGFWWHSIMHPESVIDEMEIGEDLEAAKDWKNSLTKRRRRKNA